MKRLKQLYLVVILCVAMVLSAGCVQNEEVSTEVVSELTEIPTLPPFIQEPEQTVTEVELPRAYNYIEENRMPVLRNQKGTNTCWAFASLSALESSKDEDANGIYSADHVTFHNPFGKQFEEGGSYIVTMSYLLSWKGPVLEEVDPFDEESPDGLEPSVHVPPQRKAAHVLCVYNSFISSAFWRNSTVV